MSGRISSIEVIASSTAGIEDKTRLIQEDNIQILNRDDGTTKNIRLIDKVHVHSNRLQVLHQFEEEEAATRPGMM